MSAKGQERTSLRGQLSIVKSLLSGEAAFGGHRQFEPRSLRASCEARQPLACQCSHSINLRFPPTQWPGPRPGGWGAATRIYVDAWCARLPCCFSFLPTFVADNGLSVHLAGHDQRNCPARLVPRLSAFGSWSLQVRSVSFWHPRRTSPELSGRDLAPRVKSPRPARQF